MRPLLAILLVGCSQGGGDAPGDRDPYACGWQQADPGTLESAGKAEGDVVPDWSGFDACGEDVFVRDGYGRYTMLLGPPAW